VHIAPAFGADDMTCRGRTGCGGEPGQADGHFEDDLMLVADVLQDADRC